MKRKSYQHKKFMLTNSIQRNGKAVMKIKTYRGAFFKANRKLNINS